MTEQNTAPLLENEHVKELLSIMEANKAPDRKDLLAVLDQVGAMERQLDAAVKELAAMRRELNEAREQDHPVKTALKIAVGTLENNVVALRERLDAVKRNVIEDCKNAVDAFREKGISALHNVARFFKIRPMLESMRDGLSKSIRFSEATISNVDLVSTEYHEAGLHIENMARAMAGKEVIRSAKSVGKLAKALKAPLYANHACLSAVKGSLETALSRLAVLEQAAERKPSIRKTMQTLNEQIAQGKRSFPRRNGPGPWLMTGVRGLRANLARSPPPVFLHIPPPQKTRRFGRRLWMQEDIEGRTVALSVRAGKLTARTLAKVLSAALRQIQKAHRARQTPQGRQSVKKLMNHRVSTNSLDLSGDTKLFDRVARKYNVDYAFHKTGPNKYLLFFKAGQADAITAAFSEYTKLVMGRGKNRRPSILQQLRHFGERARSRPREQERKREAKRDER